VARLSVEIIVINGTVPTSDYCDFNKHYSSVYIVGFGTLGRCRLSKMNSKNPQKCLPLTS
jgi:hypothetical protein